jgi:hypothetical protein
VAKGRFITFFAMNEYHFPSWYLRCAIWRMGIVNVGAKGHNDAMAQDHGWFSYKGDGDNSRLTDEQVVQIRVFENGCEPFVTFPEGAALGVETDQSVTAEMVARARTQLVDWR